jgi:hypothetical protein
MTPVDDIELQESAYSAALLQLYQDTVRESFKLCFFVRAYFFPNRVMTVIHCATIAFASGCRQLSVVI